MRRVHRIAMDEARNEMRIAEVPVEFAGRFAMRVVVRLAIRCVQQVERSCEPAGNGNVVPLFFLPWPERVAFVLREVLGYSRRDTALLLSMTDPQVNRLLEMARRRGATGLRSEIEEESSDAVPDSSQRAIPLSQSCARRTRGALNCTSFQPHVLLSNTSPRCLNFIP